MMFLAPAVLIGLVALPALYFFLRLTPPAPRRVVFPPLRLLRDLPAEARTPRHMPLWLLLLRLVAAGLVILGLAGPSLRPPAALPGSGPVLLVIDNGWAASPDWATRRDTVLRLIDAAGQEGRGVAILPTARDPSDTAPAIAGVMPAVSARALVAALNPQPWPADRTGAAAALRAAPDGMTRVYIADGITDGDGFTGFMQALRPARIFSDGRAAPVLSAGGIAPDGGFAVRASPPPAGGAVLAETATGAVLARAAFGPDGNAVVSVPLALGGRITKLVLAGPPSAAGTVLLDGAAHAALIGLAAGSGDAETPYLGPLFFLRRALPAGSQIVTGDLARLIADKADAIILADRPLRTDEQDAAAAYLANGGEIIRFAGPLTSGAPDDLAADALLAGDRRLGGALTWSAPQTLAPFDANSPFAGLPADAGVTITRQMLADPLRLDTTTVWARLHDGTPLVLGRPAGKGFLVSVLTTANAAWSNLAISGLFPQMLARLAGLSHGMPARSGAALRLAAALDAFGGLTPVDGTAAVTPSALPRVIVSPKAPPGFYGAAGAVALNLGGHIPPVADAVLPGAAPLAGAPPAQDFGASLIAAAVALLALDLLVSLRLRGSLRARVAAVVMLAFGAMPAARAQDAALATTLAYVITGDAATDQISADGLSYLSAVVSTHSSARLGGPAGVTPGIDGLNLYPLLYWPVLANAAAPSPAACAALTGYMQHGGLLVLDSAGGDADAQGSGAGFAPGAAAAVARVTACLNLPPLEPLDARNVLAHCFYIIPDFPGKFLGAPVYIATEATRDADGVTPVLIGQNDWAAAWAHDADGTAEQTPIPDGEAQRVIAERFGTNLVIYALTGSYKADQVNLPALLDKLGQ